MTLFLVGFMGSGKSTLGALLASQTGFSLYDTDKAVEAAFGLSVSEIFARYEERAFREKEAEVLRALPCGDLMENLSENSLQTMRQSPPDLSRYESKRATLPILPQNPPQNVPGGMLVVTGGGLPCHSDNMEWMLRHGTVVWLDTDPATVFSRLKKREDRERRPLLRGKSDEELQGFVVEKMREREAFYSRAQVWFNPAEESLESLLERLGLPPSRPMRIAP